MTHYDVIRSQYVFGMKSKNAEIITTSMSHTGPMQVARLHHTTQQLFSLPRLPPGMYSTRNIFTYRHHTTAEPHDTTALKHTPRRKYLPKNTP